MSAAVEVGSRPPHQTGAADVAGAQASDAIEVKPELVAEDGPGKHAPAPVPAAAPAPAPATSTQEHEHDKGSFRFAARSTSTPPQADSAQAINLADLAVEKSSLSHRLRTFGRAFKYLYGLTPQQVEDFMASYVIYNLDWADEKTMIDTLGPNYQDRVGECLRAYYGVVNHLCALGDVEKMYIPPFYDRRVSVVQGQMLYERAVARALDAKPGDHLLDIGCGRGRVAAHMASFTAARVTGINIDPSQVEQAIAFSKEKGLVDNEFLCRDMNEKPLPFPDASVDGFYEIQALSLCRDLPWMFGELFRVLKPGGRISILEWVSLPAYNPENPEHIGLMRRVKPLVGALGTPTPASLERDILAAGFTLTKSENASVGGLQSALIGKVDGYFRFLRQLILALVKLRLLPAHFKTLINRFCLDGEAFVRMDEMHLITTSWWIVAEKPAALEPGKPADAASLPA